MLFGHKYALKCKVGQRPPIWILFPFQNGKIRLDKSGICEWRRQTKWKATESLVPSLHWVPSAIEHCCVILCVDVLLQFNLNSIVLNQLHLISLDNLNFAKWPEPWQMGPTWNQDVTNEIPWMQMNKLGKHYRQCFHPGDFIVGIPLSLDVTQFINQGDRKNRNVVNYCILIFNG